MMAPLRSSPIDDEWHEGPLTSDAPSLSCYPSDPDEEEYEEEPALVDARGEPLRYFGRRPFGFTRDR